jgi:glycosyltransferase involved in cell wall biosynthesis
VSRTLFFTHTNPQGYRIQHYFPYLAKAGFRPNLVTTETDFSAVLKAARESDVVYVQRLLLGPFKLRLLRKAARRLVYDFDDAVMYGKRGSSLSRRLKFASMVRRADLVFCGNRFLCSEARRIRTDGVHYIPTVVDVDSYTVKPHGCSGTMVVGWMGSSSTLPYIAGIAPFFEEGPPERPLILKVVADAPLKSSSPRILFEKWEKERENAALLSFDMGVMPLRDDVWSRGKCGLKLLQYMASGLPSICHPFGAAKEIVTDGEDGLLRADQEGWREAIEGLSGDHHLRSRIGMAARATVEDRYSLQVWGPRVAELLRSL